MENKLLTYILQMQKQSSTQSVPKLPKAQKGKTVFSLKDYASNINTLSNDNIPRKPAFAKEFEQRQAFYKQQKERELKELQEREFNNRSYISQDRSTPASRAADKQRFLEAKRQEAMANSPLAQTFGSLTPGGYNPGAGAIAASQFVKTMPLIAGTAAGATALPSIIAGLNAPIAGVAGLTGNNIMNAGFAYEAAKNLPNVGRSIKTAYQKPTLNNVGNATAETALTALNALPFAAEASRGVAPLANEIKNAFTLTGPQRNLKDLKYAKKVYGPLGYQIPENLERIAQSDVLTDRTVRGLVNRDNSVYRGVNVDLEALKERLVRSNKLFSKFSGNPPQEAIDQYDVLIGNLKKANVDVNNPEEIAKYMATHIPAETGAGRAYLDPDVMKKRGISGLYTSNSKGTAEGYTYGEGYVVKAKKPTDFSSSSRKAWIDNNIPDIQTGKDYKYSRFFPKPITWKTDYQINDSKSLAKYREKLGRQKLEADYPSTPTEYNGETWDAIHPEVRRVQDRRDQLRNIAEEEYNLAADPYKEKLFTVQDRLKRRSEKYKMNNTSMFKKILNVPAVMNDLSWEGFYANRLNKLSTKNTDAWNDATLASYLEKYPELASAVPEVNPYAHYINIGKPGEKVLEAISTRKITPETWINKSRGHQGEYFRQATRREFGGMYSSGGPIVDPMGQWAHPGKITRIPSANITMQGVPYPVLGVASSGQQVMMQPGQNYNFGDAEYVDEYPMMANGGYVVTRSNDRKGKTHKVTGPGGVVKYFGDSKLGQHPKDPERKKAFYARHKSNLAGNPFFRAFARKTWEDGGTIPQYQFAGAVSSTDSLRHQAAKMMDFEAKKGSPTGTGLSNWGYHQSQMPYNMQSPNWKQPRTKDEAVNMYMQEIAPRLQNFPSAMEKGEAGDFLYNTGRDPRVYMLDQYLKSKGQSGIPNRGAYNVDTKTPAWTPQLQQSLNDEWKRNQDDIYKLPVNDRRVLLNKGRDFYYQNINKKADGTPNDSYKATWKPRIWESVNTYKKGGQTDDDREMLSGVADMLRRVNDVNNRKQIAKYMMNNFREEDVTFEPNQFLKSANAFKEGGEMIRRADGSYSRRGLWDNIRANKGSGKKPSKQMLEQERKINSMQGGGQKPIVKYKAINPDDLPHFSQWNPKPGEKEAMAAAFQKQLEDNDKYRDNDGMLESILEFVDPTGVSSWDDVARSFRNPLGSNWDRAFNLFSAIPVVGKIGKGAKAVSVAGKVATKPGVFKKVGNAALKGIDVLTGGPAMRYFDQTINPISRGFGAISGKAVQQIPYSGVRKVWGVGSDFNQMRRFQDGVISPAFNQLDNFMTQPSNNPNKK